MIKVSDCISFYVFSVRLFFCAYVSSDDLVTKLRHVLIRRTAELFGAKFRHCAN